MKKKIALSYMNKERAHQMANKQIQQLNERVKESEAEAAVLEQARLEK